MKWYWNWKTRLLTLGSGVKLGTGTGRVGGAAAIRLNKGGRAVRGGEFGSSTLGPTTLFLFIYTVPSSRDIYDGIGTGNRTKGSEMRGQ